MISKRTFHHWRGTLCLFASLVVAAAMVYAAAPKRTPLAGERLVITPVASRQSPLPPRYAFRNIEDIRVGDRVVTEVPDGIVDVDGQPFDTSLRPGETRVDPATWRLIRMQANDRWPDGTIDNINIETLQPLEWLEAHRVAVGEMAPIPLDLIEMGLPVDLFATVLAVECCPVIEMGPGRVVLTTVNHLNPAVMEMTITNDRGQSEKILPTASHRFYDLNRDAWVTTGELAPHDRLKGLTDDLRVVSLTTVPDVHTVYNMTVEGEHVYHVSFLAVESHNNCPPLPSIDSTGKVHGKLPHPKDLGKYDPDDLRHFQEELRKSVAERIRKTVDQGTHRPHGQRQGAEQDLIGAIDKHLGG